MIDLHGVVRTFGPEKIKTAVPMVEVGTVAELNSVFDYFCEGGNLILLWEPGFFSREIYRGNTILYEDSGDDYPCPDPERWEDKTKGMIGRQGTARERGQARFVGIQVTE